jgi:hypothetical protein
MTSHRWTLRAIAALVAIVGGATGLAAQGITTGAINGAVTNAQGVPIEGAQIEVRNPATGYRAGTTTRANGLYRIQGLDVGTGYAVTARRIGMAPQTRNDIRVTLAQTTRVDFQMSEQAAALQAVQVTGAASGSVISSTKTGVGKTISDTMLSRLPTLTRNFTDFAKLTPQVTTSGGGLSGGGSNLRENNVLIDGATESDLFGLGTTGIPGSQAGSKSIPLEAVKEYQVLLSPYDIRQGDFTGLLINAVTRGGTNDFRGSAFAYGRDQAITRTQPYLNDFKQRQYGLTLSGPIFHDKAFFFIAPEWQTQNRPASGTYVGQAGGPVDANTVNAVNGVLNKYGIAGGSGDQLPVQNPLTNIFARVDVNLPMETRMVARHNYGWARQDVFSRSDASSSSPTFNLTSNLFGFTSKKNASVMQFFTNLANGLNNEFNLGYTSINDFRTVPLIAPQISVRVPKVSGTGTANVVVGTERSSQGNSLDQYITELTDNLSMPFGNHTFTVGTKNVFYRVVNLFGQDRYGTWQFNSLDSLNGTCATCGGKPRASSYSVAVAAQIDSGYAKFRTAEYSFYAQDLWEIKRGMTLTYGLRADLPRFKSTPPLNQSVVDSFARRTDLLPNNTQWSPRVAFNWDVHNDQSTQIRGGIGLFTGQPPYVWLGNVFQNSGLTGYATLTCATVTPSSQFFPPNFSTTAPQKCGGAGDGSGGTNANPASALLGGRINVLGPDMRFPQDLKVSAGYDHRFATGMIENVIGTVEVLYTHAKFHPFYTNIALVEPDPNNAAALDRNGRLMYGTISGTGATPKTRGGRTEVYDVTNSNKDYSYSLTGSLQKRFTTRFEGTLSYTYMQARDVQSILNTTPNSNWRQGNDRPFGQFKQVLNRSRWEQPHRIVASGTYGFKWGTDVSAIYTGEAGMTYEYTYNADENADGASNDPVYIPKDVRDLNEIKFTGYNVAASAANVAAMQDAFDSFIKGFKCMNDQRGQIMTRNSCRYPWVNEIDVSIRQALPRWQGNRVAVQLDIINFGNLLNKNWGRQPGTSPGLPGVFLLSRTGTTTDASGKTQGIYTFDTNFQRASYTNVFSNYRMQLGARYSF